MRRWGYRFVVTPTLEPLDTLEAGLGPEQVRRLFKFADADGRLLAVVGEKTVPVARLAAGALRDAPLPLRLCYAGPVLGNDAGRFANRRETHQAGAELLGAPGPVADAEVIALAARSLGAAGLRGFQVEIGHSEFFLGLLAGLRLPAAAEQGIRAALSARDLVALGELLEGTPLRSAERELLLRFPALRGGREILDAAAGLVSNRRSSRALDQLGRVEELLRAHGLGEAVNLDLGAIRDFDYYTGVTFEFYGPDLGRPLAAGGRYDRLLERFGRPAAATGFVVELDLLAEALARTEGGAPAGPRLNAAVAWTAAGVEQALRVGATLRLFGMRVAVDTEARSANAARGWAQGAGARHLIHCTGAARVAWIEADMTRRLAPEDLAGQLAGRLAGRLA